MPALLLKLNITTMISKNMKMQTAEIVADPVKEDLLGLFSKVKDSPRHIAIKAERLIDEAYRICAAFYHDKHPADHLTAYSQEIESDMGWHYASEIVMSMAYNILKVKGRKTKKISQVMTAIENMYHNSCYWPAFQMLEPRRSAAVVTIGNQKDYTHGLPIIIQGNASINLYSPGNFISKKIEYGKG